LEVLLKGSDGAFREHSDAVFHTLAISHDDLALGEVKVFDSEVDGFHKAQPAAIYQLSDKLGIALGRQRASSLLSTVGRPFGPGDFDVLIDGLMQHFLVEE
jgi:hypothetical protein